MAYIDEKWRQLILINILQVGESITRQEQIIAEIQDLYQPFIQERGGGGGAREDALKSLASVSAVFVRAGYHALIIHFRPMMHSWSSTEIYKKEPSSTTT